MQSLRSMTHSGRVTGHAGARIHATIHYTPDVVSLNECPSPQVNQWSISDKRQLCISKSRILERLAPGQLGQAISILPKCIASRRKCRVSEKSVASSKDRTNAKG